MRLLFVTDLHGSRRKYDEVLAQATARHVDVVVNGGDMLPNEGNLFRQNTFISGFLRRHFERFEQAGIPYLCCLGNDDLRIWDELFDATCRQYRGIHNLAQRKVTVNGAAFIGMNWVTDYPFVLKDRCRMDARDFVFPPQFGPALLSGPRGWTEVDDWFACARRLPTLADELACLPRPDRARRNVYVIHMPPCRLGLDLCTGGLRVGSPAVYQFLRAVQPTLSLHGHIHESPDVGGVWQAMLGNTVCVQPGQPDRLAYVLADLETMRIERHVV
ncbi:MAG: metallophosphoesterase [Sedimentisphaerales bacterium]|nr:metallophosphoesterase [Sedimentisphaerales bacterium]